LTNLELDMPVAKMVGIRAEGKNNYKEKRKYKNFRV
jgi:hypothetical protein